MKNLRPFLFATLLGAAAAEPLSWLTSADDATPGLTGIGSVGLRTTIGAPVTNGPMVISLDALDVRRR